MSVTQNAGSIYSQDYIGNIDFSPDGQSLLTTSMDEIKVTLWDVADQGETGTLDGFETAAPVYSVKFGEDGKHVIWIARGNCAAEQYCRWRPGPVNGARGFCQ